MEKRELCSQTNFSTPGLQIQDRNNDGERRSNEGGKYSCLFWE
jgi:hypothetical protein